MEKIRVRIKDQASLGIKRAIILQHIQIDLVENLAYFTVIEKYLNNTESEIEDQTITTRTIMADLSNKVKVTATGIPITLDFIKSTIPIRADETPQQYEVRMQKRLENELKTGLKQFDFWIDKMINPVPTLDLIKIFNNLGKFN
jgi:hypothetical protein